jgi:dTDP-4-amino-4,6-dideoxygalactose transaminase
VRYWDYLAHYGAHRDEYLQAIDAMLSGGRLILGPEVERFERDLAAYCGVSWGVGVNSGTDAIFLSLKALGVGPGDEVITVANTAVPTVAAIRATGATPVFVDVEEETGLMDVAGVGPRLTETTRCILPVHLCGQPVDMPPLMAAARERGIPVLEDCAQAFGATVGGLKVGSFGDLGAFSFYPTKILGAFGDGGMAVTSRADLHTKLRRLRFYGMEKEYYAEEEGFNSRLDELQACILNLKLAGVDAAVGRRREIARAYTEGLFGVGDLALPPVGEGIGHQFYLYTVRTSRRDLLRKHLAAQGIETKVNYPVPIHLMRGYSFLGYREGDLPVTERLAGSILSLPIYPELSNGAVGEVIRAVRSFFDSPDSGARG